MNRFCSIPVLLAITIAGLDSETRADGFSFRDGDRVVLLGGTFVERAQRYGHLELELTLASGGGALFRNLGWSGDTVWAESRGIFDQPQAGYQRMLKQIRDLKPTVLIIAYGANEAFAGDAGLPRFEQQYNRLLDDLSSTSARVVLVSPTPLIRMPPPLPDPTAQNKRLAVYSRAIQQIAERRKVHYVDLFGPLSQSSAVNTDSTDDGVHFNDAGYALVSKVFVDELVGSSRLSKIGKKIDRKKSRDLITHKNMLFFHHWRPQNVTYLFLFRKHEQGNNAKEIDDFLMLVHIKDIEIANSLRPATKPKTR